MNWLLLKNSLLVATPATALALVLGFCAALCISGLERRWRNLLLACAILAIAWPPFLVTNCWLHYLGYTGVWRDWLPFNIFSLGGTVWILALMTWPITALFLYSGWRRIEPAYFEVEPMLRGLPLIRWLLLPMGRTALLQAAVLTFVLALNNFAVPAILQVKVFPAEVWVSFNTTFDYFAAVQLGWPLLIAPLLLLLIFRKQIVRWNWRQAAVSPRFFRQQLGPAVFLFSGVVAVVVIFFAVILPLFQLAGSSQTWSQFAPALNAGKSALLNSVFFAGFGATAVVLIALFTPALRGRTVAWIFFLVPGVLLGLLLIWLLNRPALGWFYQSIGVVILAFIIRYFALGWNGIANAMQSSDRNLADMARIEGANKWQLLHQVQLPQILPQVCAAWYVVYLLCLWDVETLVLIVPPGSETVALRIFNLLHYGHTGQVNALCFLLLLLAVLPLIVFWGARDLSRVSGKIQGSAGGSPCRGWIFLPLLCLSGCSVSIGNHGENRFPVESRFFSHVEIIGSRGTGSGQFNKPRSLALDADDNLFVVDMTGRVQKFSPDGAFILSWQMPQTDKGRPKGMGRDAAGNIIVIEPHYSRVNHFSSDGRLQFQWGSHGLNDGQLAFPRAIAVNSRGDLYVCEYGITERAQQFTARGEFINAFGGAGNGAGQFNRLEGLSIDAKDQLYAADSCNHRIQIFSADGKFLRTYGKAGSGVNELSYPYDIRVERSGLQFVCEFGNSRIQIFDEHDRSVEILGGPGAAPGQFANPWSIAIDSKGNLYVADSQNHRVQKFVRKRA